jgi:hypothetical protein
MKSAGLKLCLGAAALVLALGRPAAAQSAAPAGADGPGLGIDFNAAPSVDPETAEKRKEIERAYRDASKKIPARAAAANDPWANMRGADEARPEAKPAAKTTQKTVQKKKPPAQ